MAKNRLNTPMDDRNNRYLMLCFDERLEMHFSHFRPIKDTLITRKSFILYASRKPTSADRLNILTPY